MITRIRDSALLVLAYVAAAWVGISYSSLSPGNLSMLWLPSGIATVGLIVMGWRALPLVFIATSWANWPSLLDVSSSATFAHTFGHALVSSVLDTLQPAIAAWMYRRACAQGCLNDEKSLLMFILGVAFVPSLLTSWAIILNFQIGGYVEYDSIESMLVAMRNTTITDALGIFIILPVYDAIIGLRGRSAPRKEVIEFVVLVMLLGTFLYWVTQTDTIRPIVLLVPLTGLALRNGVVGSSSGYLITSVALIIATAQGRGPYSIRMMDSEFFSLMTYLIAIGPPIHLIAITMRNNKFFAATLERRVRQRTAELLEKEARLREVNRDKDRLMSIIGHDLRNPIQGIIGMGELIVEETREKQYGDLETYGLMIQSSARQSLQLLQNLLDWSASHSGRLQFDPQPTDISKLVGETLATMSDVARLKSVDLKIDVELGLTASVDKRMMSTILRNLLSNAVKFTQPGGHITFSARSSDTGFCLSVGDTGVGMSDSQIQRFFEQHTSESTAGTGGEKGSGLGLILVHEFAQKHNARLSIDSTVGEGTRIRLDFPH